MTANLGYLQSQDLVLLWTCLEFLFIYLLIYLYIYLFFIFTQYYFTIYVKSKTGDLSLGYTNKVITRLEICSISLNFYLNLPYFPIPCCSLNVSRSSPFPPPRTICEIWTLLLPLLRKAGTVSQSLSLKHFKL